jgi:hypothetical protein
MLRYLNQRGIPFKEVYGHLIFDDVLNYETVDEPSLKSVTRLNVNIEYSAEEINNALFFLVQVAPKNALLIDDFGNKTYKYSNHSRSQVGPFKITRIYKKKCLVGVQQDMSVMFCNKELKNILEDISIDFSFCVVEGANNTERDDLFQVESKNQIPTELINVNCDIIGEDNIFRANKVVYDDCVKICPRFPNVYVPELNYADIKNYEVFTTGHCFGSGFGYKMLFCSSRVFKKLKETKFFKEFSFKPVTLT